MKTIQVYASIGLVGCRRQDEFEVEDDATDDEIEELARDVAFEFFDWGWKVAKAEDES